MGDIMALWVPPSLATTPDAFVSLFATDYQSDQPAHPMRTFSGAD